MVGTPLNVVWNSSVSYFTAEDYRNKVTWYDSSAMLFNGAGSSAAQLMGSGVTAYSAATGEELCSTSGFREVDSIADSLRNVEQIRSMIFSALSRRSWTGPT